MKKVLIVYYTWSNGNTEKIAGELQRATRADLEQISMVHPYMGSYEEVVAQGKRESIEARFRQDGRGCGWEDVLRQSPRGSSQCCDLQPGRDMQGQRP